MKRGRVLPSLTQPEHSEAQTLCVELYICGAISGKQMIISQAAFLRTRHRCGASHRVHAVRTCHTTPSGCVFADAARVVGAAPVCDWRTHACFVCVLARMRRLKGAAEPFAHTSVLCTLRPLRVLALRPQWCTAPRCRAPRSRLPPRAPTASSSPWARQREVSMRVTLRRQRLGGAAAAMACHVLLILRPPKVHHMTAPAFSGAAAFPLPLHAEHQTDAACAHACVAGVPLGIKGIATAVKTMKRGEEVQLVLTPECEWRCLWGGGAVGWCGKKRR